MRDWRTTPRCGLSANEGECGDITTSKEADDRSRRQLLCGARGGATARKRTSSTWLHDGYTSAGIYMSTTEDAAVTCRVESTEQSFHTAVVRHGCALPAIVPKQWCQAESLAQQPLWHFGGPNQVVKSALRSSVRCTSMPYQSGEVMVPCKRQVALLVQSL